MQPVKFPRPELNLFDIFTPAHLEGMAHLSLVEVGAYFLLVKHYVMTRKPLRNDIYELCRIIRADQGIDPEFNETRVVDRILDEFFILEGDGMRYHAAIDGLLNAQQ